MDIQTPGSALREAVFLEDFVGDPAPSGGLTAAHLGA
jgi:hypothetical protein